MQQSPPAPPFRSPPPPRPGKVLGIKRPLTEEWFRLMRLTTLAIVIIVIFAALAGILLVLLQPSFGQIPEVKLERFFDSNTTTSIVAEVSIRKSLNYYRVVLEQDELVVVSLNPLRETTIWPLYPLSFDDFDNDGHLTEGDRFIVYTSQGSMYRLILFYRDVEIASQSWVAR